MASENRANYAKIGVTLVAGIAAILATLVYLGGAGDRRDEFFAETYFDSDVSGLSVGSDVTFRGVKVGTVREITFVRNEYEDATDEDGQKILVVMALPRMVGKPGRERSNEEIVGGLVERGLRATVSSSGITGLSNIRLDYPKAALGRPQISWQPSRICIPPAPSMFESFSDSAMRVMSQLDDMDFAGAWSNLTAFAGSVSHLADDAGALFESQRAAICEIIGQIEAASADLREFASEVKDNPSLLLRPRDGEPLPETRR